MALTILVIFALVYVAFHGRRVALGRSTSDGGTAWFSGSSGDSSSDCGSSGGGDCGGGDGGGGGD